MINETTEGQEAGEQREELFFKVIEAGNKILEILAALFIILMLLYGAYSLWDTCQINRRAFISGELMKYKPAGKTDESPSLPGTSENQSGCVCLADGRRNKD